MTSQRIVPLGIALTLVMAACGADDPGAGSDNALRPPVPVQVTAGGGDTGGGRVAAEMASDDIAGSSMPWFGGFEFEVGPGLPALPTNSTGYQFIPGDVDVAEVTRLAEALGVTGEPVRGGGADVDGRLWQVGPDDGTAPSLTVVADAQSSWYYSSAWADATVSGSVNEPCRIDDTGTDVCPEPTPPEGVPSAAEAEADARARLDAMGVDSDDFRFETFADDWYASVTASQSLGAVSSPVSWSFGYGAEARLQWAGGYLAEPVATGPYPLIDLDTALARLADQSGMWGGMARAGAVNDVAVAADVSGDAGASDAMAGEAAPPAESLPVEPTAPDEALPPDTVPAEPAPTETLPATTLPPVTVPAETVPAETVPVETLPVETLPVETVPEIETEVAVLVDVRADLWWAWDADGSIWLLPAYTFTDTEGRTHTVPAVTEEYLIVVEPEPLPEPMPVEPLDPGLVDPGLVDPGLVDPLPIDEPVSLDDYAGIVGLSLDDANAKVGDVTVGGAGVGGDGTLPGVTLRVVRLDGEDLPATADYLPTRINVAVENDVITELISVG
jgi:hypothetical protein